MDFLTRAAWGARPLDHRARNMTAPASRLIVHHSDGAAAPFTTGLKGVEREHMDTRRWSGPAYNVAAGSQPGEAAELRGWGIQTIATLGANAGSWTICAIGDFEDHEPPPALLENVAVLAVEGIRRGHLAPNFVISGHRDHGQTACPGRFLYPHLAFLEARVHELRGVPLPPTVPASERPVLRRGDRGQHVASLQRAMRELAMQQIVGPAVFGPATERAVRNWQRFFGLPVDGVVDGGMWETIYAVAALQGKVVR